MITKEKLEAKKAELAKQLEELRNNMHAVAGAIQFCDLLLAETSTPKSPATPSEP